MQNENRARETIDSEHLKTQTHLPTKVLHGWKVADSLDPGLVREQQRYILYIRSRTDHWAFTKAMF